MALITLDVHLKDSDLHALVTTLNSLNSKALTAAFRRTNRKVARWLSAQLVRSISQQYGLKSGAFRKARVLIAQADLGSANKPMHVFIGANPVSAHFLDTPRHERDYGGTFAGGYFFKGAFAAKGYDGDLRVYKRRSAKRLPIDVQGVDIKHGAIENTKRLMARAEKHYQKVLYQEINFELSKLA